MKTFKFSGAFGTEDAGPLHELLARHFIRHEAGEVYLTLTGEKDRYAMYIRMEDGEGDVHLGNFYPMY